MKNSLSSAPRLTQANELARQIASRRGAAFGWHRISLSQLVSIVSAQELAQRRMVPLTRIGTDAITTRLIHRLTVERGWAGTLRKRDTGLSAAIAVW